MNVKILYAPDYGVPQIRKRAFFVGILDSDVQFEYPNPTVKAENYVTCEQAIGDLPSLINENNSWVKYYEIRGDILREKREIGVY